MKRLEVLELGILRGNGGAEGDRTPDLDIANVALSQLSYCPARGGADYVAMLRAVSRFRAGPGGPYPAGLPNLARPMPQG